METLDLREIGQTFATLASTPGLTPVQSAFVDEFASEVCKIILAKSTGFLIRSEVMQVAESARSYLFEIRPLVLGFASHVRTRSIQAATESAGAARQRARSATDLAR
jgi:hypothetical protein